MSIDQGTTGSTVLLFDHELNVLAKSTHEFPQIFPQPGWVSHDPEEIWNSVEKSITAVLKNKTSLEPGCPHPAKHLEPGCPHPAKHLEPGCPHPARAPKYTSPTNISAIGITNQRETTILWDRKTGEVLHDAIVWQCRRTEPICQELKDQGFEQTFINKTGLVLDPYFSGTKIKWLFDNIPGIREKAAAGEVAFGTVDSYLVWRLTGGAVHITDVTNASRTLLMNLETLEWDDELLSILDIPRSILPEIKGCSEVYGTTVKTKYLPAGIPIAGIAGDQQAALFGQMCLTPGDVKCTFGTGAFLLMNTGAKPIRSSHGLLSTVAWKIGDEVTYALEGSAFIAGAAVQWLRDNLRVIKNASEIEELASKVEDSAGLVFVPALAGLGAPHWRPDAKGLLTGIDRGTTLEHIARAVLEGIALQNCDLLNAMQQDLGHNLTTIRVDGGAAANNLLMQIQSDLLGANLIRPKILETTALGAGLLAGLAVGIWKNTDEPKTTISQKSTENSHCATQRVAQTKSAPISERRINNLNPQNLFEQLPKTHLTPDRTFTPNMSQKQKETLIRNWQTAIKKA